MHSAGPPNGPITFILARKQALDGYAPDFSGPGYYQMKKSMASECEMEADEPQLEADPKHKGTVKKLKETAEALHKASRLHGEQAETLEGLIVTLSRSPDD